MAKFKLQKNDIPILGKKEKKAGTGASAETAPTEAEAQAATKIQATWKSYAERGKVAAIAQQTTPYSSRAQYLLATNAYAPNVMRDRPIGWPLRSAEYGVYWSTSNIPAGQPAFLHSFQRKEELEDARQAYQSPRGPKIGNVYNPSAFGQHDMRANSAWVLGLAHHGKPVLLTTSLDDETLVRRSAKNGPAKFQNTDHNFSALGREVLAMVQNDQFKPMPGPLGKQLLIPTEKAKSATLEDMKTPSGMPKKELKKQLEGKGIDVNKISSPSFFSISSLAVFSKSLKKS